MTTRSTSELSEVLTAADEWLPPQDVPAEERVIGAMLRGELSPTAVRPGDLYRHHTALLVRVVQALAVAGEPVSVEAVCTELERRDQLDLVGDDIVIEPGGRVVLAGGRSAVAVLANTAPVEPGDLDAIRGAAVQRFGIVKMIVRGTMVTRPRPVLRPQTRRREGRSTRRATARAGPSADDGSDAPPGGRQQHDLTGAERR